MIILGMVIILVLLYLLSMTTFSIPYWITRQLFILYNNYSTYFFEYLLATAANSPPRGTIPWVANL